MTSRTPGTCQHELRPGTKVCLHCRRAEREARAARQRAILTRIGLTAAAIGAVGYAGLVGFRAWQGKGSPTLGALLATPAPLEAAPVQMLTVSAPSTAPAAASVAVGPGVSPAVGDSTKHDSVPAGSVLAADSGSPTLSVAPATPIESLAVPAASTPVAAPAAPPTAAPVVSIPAVPVAAPPLQPVVAEGRTELQNGIYALRRGDTVTVHFDTPDARTRRPEKFEQIVRATLPAVHGAAAARMLAGIANGNLVGPGETITEPQGSGISLRSVDGKSLSVLPQTRPGRDGPLVVAYRVTPTR